MHKPVYVVVSLSPQAPRLHMHVDASKVVWGASITHEGTETAFALEWWPKSLSQSHSDHTEARAPLEGLLALQNHIPRGCLLTFHSDCSSVVWGLRKGSSKPQMTDRLCIFTVSLAEQGSQLAVLHVPAKENVRADQLSRTPDQHHYSLRQDVFDRPCGCHIFQCQVSLFPNIQILRRVAPAQPGYQRIRPPVE